MPGETENTMALVEAGARDVRGYDAKEFSEELRRQREVHRHKQIWIKEPHGGPYRKVGSNFGCLRRSKIPLTYYALFTSAGQKQRRTRSFKI